MERSIMSDVAKNLPALPGVYLFKDANHTVIYIGKAKQLRKRVQSYFVNQKTDWKIAELIKEHASIAHIVTHNETEALLLEAQLIRDYKPKFNVLLKSGQPFVYLLFTEIKGAITLKNLPQLEVVRNKKKKGIYFGPFLHKTDARSVHDYLLRTFKLIQCNKSIANGCLDYHLGRCAGSCKVDFDQTGYLTRLQLAQDVLEGNHKQFLKRLHELIATYNTNLEFEKAAHISHYITNFETIFATIKTKFHEQKYALEVEEVALQPVLPNVEAEQALAHLQHILGLETPIRTIDCFDISHFQSTHMVGSCIRFTNGKKDPNNFRRFKIKSLDEQNDYAALQEIVTRRYKNPEDLPDVVLIDGGKGQRNAILPLLPNTPCISLAKREERLFVDRYPSGIIIDFSTPLGRLLMALRDYAHHFAITYHRKKRSKSL